MDSSQKFRELLKDVWDEPKSLESGTTSRLPFELPDPRSLIEEGADPQFAIYTDVMSRLLAGAIILEGSGEVVAYHQRVEEELNRYAPGYPPMSPVTDSFFYLWALCDLKFGEKQENIGQIVVEQFRGHGASREMLRICDRLLSARMAIYETLGEHGDQLVVRELVTNEEMLVDTPTGFRGTAGTLRFARLAPPVRRDVPWHTELTTPYILTGQSAEQWTEYLQRVMPEAAVNRGGKESQLISDRLAAVFRDDCGTLPWMEFVFQGYSGFDSDAVFVTGIPDRPDTLPHSDSRALSSSGTGVVTALLRRMMAAGELRPDGTAAYEVEELEEDDASFSEGLICRMRIDLKGAKPPIWRRIEVPDCPLSLLHQLIQKAMGWTNCHLHEFQIDGERFVAPDPFGEYSEVDPDVEDADDCLISDVIGSPGMKFSYIYDFGDDWEHTIRVESIHRPAPDTEYPRCVTGSGQCPPEDCGGIPGYRDLLDALSDPEHPEHKAVSEWYAPFDPAGFDPLEHTRDMQFVFHEHKQFVESDEFDFNEDFFADGDLDEIGFEEYVRELVQQFQESPEGGDLAHAGFAVATVLRYGATYLGVSPATMTASDLEEILFELVPRKVTIEPDEALPFLVEFRGFLRFIQREYAAANAVELLEVIGHDDALVRLKDTLADESGFGMAKSLVMQGRRAGFDTTTEAGLTQLFAAYNAGLQQRDPDPAGDTEPVTATIRRTEPRVGRNDPCPCGSGKKHKKCCLKS